MSGIEDRSRSEMLLAVEKRLLEMVAVGQDLPIVLAALCTVVNESSSGCHCSILLVEPGGRTVRHAAAPTLPASVTHAIDGQTTADPYWGPCAMAIDQKRPVIVPDIRHDSRWGGVEWGELALAAGLQSCWTTPILSRAGTPLGTFAIYQESVGAPTLAQTEIIERFTHIASIAVGRRHADEQRRRHEVIIAEAERLSLTGSSCWQPPHDELIWSKEMFRIFDLDPTVTPTVHLVRDRIHPEDLPHFNHTVECAVRDGQDFAVEPRLLMADGSIKYLQVLTRAVRDDHGNVVEFIGAVKDVTDRRRSDDALSKLRSELAHMARVATLGALTASIAHEVNQPLAGIVTNASTSLLLLADDPPNISAAIETARRTIRDANRASEVITRLRALFKKASIAKESLNLNDATSEVLALLRGELQRNQVMVRLELANALPPVHGDRVQLQQVVLNLILNAAEAMAVIEDRPRQLVVRTGLDEGNHVKLSVSDTGPGLDPETLHRIFETFYTTKREGMGIGLSISRSIIESHHGRLWGTANDGAGATFAFSIPRLPPTDAMRGTA